MKFLWLIILTSFPALTQCIDEPKAINLLANISLKRYSEKISVIESYLKLGFCTKTSDTIIAKYYDNLGEAYYETGQKEKAIKTAKIGLAIWQKYKTQKPKGLSFAAYYIAYYYQLTNNYLYAIDYYKLAISYSNREPFWADCYKNISDIQLELGDYENQLNNLMFAESYAKKANNYHVLSDINNAKSMAYFRIENYKQSINELDKAVANYKLCKKEGILDNFLLANIHINYGHTFTNLNNVNKAINHYKIAQSIFTKLKLYDKIAETVLGSIGILETNRGNYALGKKSFEKALSIHSSKSSANYSRLLLNYAENLSKQGEFQKVDKYLQIAIKKFPKFSLEKLNFEFVLEKRTLFYILRNYAKNQLQLHKHQKKPDLLLSGLEFFGYADKLLNVMRNEHKTQLSKTFWREHTRSFYENAIEASYLANDVQKAYYFIEQSRALLLLDDVKENEARQLLSKTDKTIENNFQQKLVELQLQLESQFENSANYQRITTEIASQKIAFNDFKKALEKKYPTYFATKYRNDFKKLDEVQNWLKSNNQQAIIEYFVGDTATYAFKILPDKAQLFKLAKSDNNLSSFSSKCTNLNYQNSNFNAFLNESNSIFNQIIKPLNLPKGRIIISYDGSFLPFETLSASATRPQYLLESNAISYAYSANLLLQNINNKNKSQNYISNQSFIGFAPSQFNNQLKLNDLPQSELAINKLENIYNGKLFLGRRATKASFLKEYFNNNIVQIFTHADIDTTINEPVFYMQDARIRMSEIFTSQKVITEMICLSACKTGLGQNIKGEGVFSLSRAFSALGIPSLITTLWDVEEKATYNITELFYKNLKNGMTKDIALQKAKLEFISQNDRNQLPSLWASSILIGDSMPMTNNHYLFILATSIFLICLILFFSRKKL
jgi:CHAT domain-containing protein